MNKYRANHPNYHLDPNGVPVVTPNYARTCRRAIRQDYENARKHLTAARELRAVANGRLYYLELVQREICCAAQMREDAHEKLRFLKDARVEKYSNISQKAARRIQSK